MLPSSGQSGHTLRRLSASLGDSSDSSSLALYSNEDIYLLDDPLSAVDSEVANHIFDKCICDYLKTKTVVLVTHQIQFIQKATKILVLKEGRSLAFGTLATKKTNLLQRNINTRVQWMGECIGIT
ncbi:unnamed protein product [Oppiella nova]|uniref:Uncharacterized protein n=1 Tax=Oppiella nova TaxID=334625 RepID=A0A7R9M8X6_9ACAR|nr:unnamed protein product [Oppiella nova]CAG2172999.1 unnamed protein product [Oppiella nova]